MGAGDGRVGLLGEHGECACGLHLALRRVFEDPSAPAPPKREAREAPIQEMGRGSPSFHLDRGCDCLHSKQHVSHLCKEA